ncbi:MAG: helix-turn-helix transcriptional regulator [Sedimentisphaerales bacterium]
MYEEDIIKRIGLNITIIREKRGLTQERLAESTGLHRAYIGQIERGEKNIGLKNLEKIAKGLNVQVKDLLD